MFFHNPLFLGNVVVWKDLLCPGIHQILNPIIMYLHLCGTKRSAQGNVPFGTCITTHSTVTTHNQSTTKRNDNLFDFRKVFIAQENNGSFLAQRNIKTQWIFTPVKVSWRGTSRSPSSVTSKEIVEWFKSLNLSNSVSTRQICRLLAYPAIFTAQ